MMLKVARSSSPALFSSSLRLTSSHRSGRTRTSSNCCDNERGLLRLGGGVRSEVWQGGRLHREVGVSLSTALERNRVTRGGRCSSSGNASASNGSEEPLDNKQEGGLWGKLKSFAQKGKGFDRKKLASLGTSVLLSYGFVSNVNACTLVTIAWVICGRSTGLSPLAAGNWKAFLGIYGGLYLSFGNLLRPIRASIAIAISPLFEKFVNFLQSRLKVKRPVAFGMTVFLVNVLGSISYFALAITVACLVFRVPLLP